MRRIFAALAIAVLPLAAYAQSLTPSQRSEINQMIYDYLLSCNVATGCPLPAPPPVAPTVTFSANPTSVAAGSASTLSWSSTNATACVASNSWIGTKPPSGTTAVTPAATSIYGLSCSGPGGTTAVVNVTVTVTAIPPVTGNCGLLSGGTAIFCDKFDTVNPGIPSRTGALHPDVWGVSRTTGNMNIGQFNNGWAASAQLKMCNGTVATVSPPNDVAICNGQLREVINDNAVLVLAMYPKQPFDFAGRTGTVSFDVSNDTHGTHAAWPEFWMSNLPVPAPFNHFETYQSLPEHGFGIRFGGLGPPGQVGLCPNGNNLDKLRWTVDSAVIVRNYVQDDTNGLGGVRTNMNVQIIDCVIAPPDESGVTNHVELKISQNQIDVYATDAGVMPTAANLRRIAVVTNANLSFSRGLIWLQDVHYNPSKETSLPNQTNHMFAWDNVAFDGPFTYRDFSYDALDNNEPAGTFVNLGKMSLPGQTSSWNVLGLPANRQAAAVRVLFNYYTYGPPTTINVIVNGHPHSAPHPYQDGVGYTWRTFAMTIPITDLVTGTNIVQIGTTSPFKPNENQATVTSNVNIVLVDVPGGVPVLPGSNNAYPH